MRSRQIATIFVSLILLWQLAGCQTGAEKVQVPLLTPTPEKDTGFSWNGISSANLESMKELQVLPGENEGLIADLVFSENASVIWAAHPISGIVEQWNLNNSKLIKHIEVPPGSAIATQLSPNGELLAMASGNTKPAIDAGLSKDFPGVGVWSLENGDLVWEWGYSREEADSLGRAREVAWSEDNLFLAIEVEYAIYHIRVDDWSLYMTDGINIEDENGYPIQLAAVAFDASGTWIFYGSEQGMVYGHSVLGHGYHVVGSLGDDYVLRIDSSPTNRYVAAAGVHTLKVWDVTKIGSWFTDGVVLQSSHDDTPAADLAFSPDGKLLAVGMQDMWQIWSVEQGKLLVEHPQGSYALTFSPDGRLFVWGDLDGNVHILGGSDEK